MVTLTKGTSGVMTETTRNRPRKLEAIELFHLAFLEVLPTRLDQRAYVLKGGANLRYFYGSPRFSEDVDFDVVGIAKSKLEEQVDKVLSSRALAFILQTSKVFLRQISKPKQTETTQRWKVGLSTEGAADEAIRTRLEFSRRTHDNRCQLDQIPAAIVEPYALRPPTVSRYLPAAMTKFKIQALARRTETQARDVFDLDLLFRQHPELTRAGAIDCNRLDIVGAIDRAVELPFEAYRSQVVAFLAPEVLELYENEPAWTQMQEHVVEVLTRLR